MSANVDVSEVLHHDSAGLPVGLVVVGLASDLVVTLHSNLALEVVLVGDRVIRLLLLLGRPHGGLLDDRGSLLDDLLDNRDLGGGGLDLLLAAADTVLGLSIIRAPIAAARALLLSATVTARAGLAAVVLLLLPAVGVGATASAGPITPATATAAASTALAVATAAATRAARARVRVRARTTFILPLFLSTLRHIHLYLISRLIAKQPSPVPILQRASYTNVARHTFSYTDTLSHRYTFKNINTNTHIHTPRALVAFVALAALGLGRVHLLRRLGSRGLLQVRQQKLRTDR
jgi:hypothetical protein